MKAISIKQPWAEMIARGIKTIEIRTWKTSYRGKLLICAALKPAEGFDLSKYNLVYGHALAVAELVDITTFLKEHETKAHCDHIENAYAWHLSKVQRIKPFKIKGQQRLFNIEF